MNKKPDILIIGAGPGIGHLISALKPQPETVVIVKDQHIEEPKPLGSSPYVIQALEMKDRPIIFNEPKNFINGKKLPKRKK